MWRLRRESVARGGDRCLVTGDVTREVNTQYFITHTKSRRTTYLVAGQETCTQREQCRCDTFEQLARPIAASRTV